MESKNDLQRLHAFDNARAVMMWLGIVLHVCLNHLTFPLPIPWKDAHTSETADLLFMFIHSFRMPVFFVLSGFLSAMMVSSRGAEAMVRNRVRRLALPFALFWPVLLIGMGLLAMKFMQLMPARPPTTSPPPIGPMHMWFIYYLLMYALLAATCKRLFPAGVQRIWGRVWSALIAHWWMVPVLAVPLGIAGAFYPNGMVHTNQNFMPNPGALVYYGIFFLFGWTAYATRSVFVDRIRRYYGPYLVAGLVSFGITLALLGQNQLGNLGPLIAYSAGLTGILWSVGMIGLFVRFFPQQNKVLRYIADSSYWVFLVHMLGTMGFGVLLYDADLGARAKIIINIIATTVVCLVSYHFLVRNTWIGVLLNGRKHTATNPTAVKVAATPMTDRA